MPRILVINSNASPVATKHIEQGCLPIARSDTELTFVTAAAGPEAIDTPLDVAISALETSKIVAAQKDAFDAFVIAAGDDPGIDVARQVTDKPVVGIAEAGLLFACTLGARLTVLTALRCEIPRTWELVRKYGLADRTASVRALEPARSSGFASAGLIAEPLDLLDQFAIEASRAISDDLAEVIVVIGSVTCAVAAPLGERVKVPVVSGTLCAVKLAESLIDLGLRTSRAYKFRTPTKQDELVGYPEFQGSYSLPEGQR